MVRETPKEYLIREDEKGDLMVYHYEKEISAITGNPEYMFVMGYYNCIAIQIEDTTEYSIIAVTDPVILNRYRKLRKVITREELDRKYQYDNYITISWFDTKYYDFERTDLEGELNGR